MDAKRAILILKSIKRQFQVNIDEAIGDKDALEALDDNKNTVQALATNSLKRDIKVKIKEIVLNIGEYENVTHKCDICNWNVELQDRFCKHCGQKLRS